MTFAAWVGHQIQWRDLSTRLCRKRRGVVPAVYDSSCSSHCSSCRHSGKLSFYMLSYFTAGCWVGVPGVLLLTRSWYPPLDGDFASDPLYFMSTKELFVAVYLTFVQFKLGLKCCLYIIVHFLWEGFRFILKSSLSTLTLRPGGGGGVWSPKFSNRGVGSPTKNDCILGSQQMYTFATNSTFDVY